MKEVCGVEDSATSCRDLLIGKTGYLVPELSVSASRIHDMGMAVAERRHHESALGIYSTFAYACGYVGGVIPFLVCLALSLVMKDKVAVITGPVVGDIGIAVFAQKDTSNVVAGTDKPVQAGSFRKFSMSDGWYIGGFLNQAPETFLQLNQDGTAVLTANSGITINGDITLNGQLTATGDIRGNGHSLSNHTHTGVHGETSSANG